MIIALDAMGGDNAPAIVVEGASIAHDRDPSLQFLLFGDETKLRPLLDRHPQLKRSVDLRHTADVVSGDAKPSIALRQGRNSSMGLAVEAVSSDEAAAAVSAGNTGALMAMAIFRLKTLPGIDRPAIASVLPSKTRSIVILDLGANVDSDARHLFQFAVMGEVFARVILDVPKPRVGLLNVGTEEVKGDSVVRKAASLVRDSGLDIDYAGFVEGNDVTDGRVDVVVTDGFTGNVALKVAEGTASMFMSALKETLESSWRARVGYLLARPALRGMRDRFDPRLYNGAMFLGVNGVIVKSHGSADGLGFSAAIRTACELVGRGTNDRIIDELRAANESYGKGGEANVHGKADGEAVESVAAS